MSGWENKSSKETTRIDDIKERISLAKKAPDKAVVIAESFLNLFESPWIRILVAVLCIYLVWLILN